MREILFRGKAANRIDGRAYRTNYKNGDWVYGLLTDAENYAGFSEMTNTNGVSGIEVDKNTVGQFTGLTDKNGKKIFEGDIVEYYPDGMVRIPQIGRVEFHDGAFGVMLFEKKGIFLTFAANYCKVLGNIHDNPELLTKDSAIDDLAARP